MEEDLPPFLYRWTNVESQGINTGSLGLSGLFSDTKQEFCQFFTKHVSIVKSPLHFISTSLSLLAPVHGALPAREGAMVSIVDSSTLQTEVYSVWQVVRELDIRFCLECALE